MNRQSSARTDEELAALLDEEADWVLMGNRRTAVGHAPTLRSAILEAYTMQQAGVRVAYLARGKHYDIMVFSAQFWRLMGKNPLAHRKVGVITSASDKHTESAQIAALPTEIQARI